MKYLKTEAFPKFDELRKGLEQIKGFKWIIFLVFSILMIVGIVGITAKINSQFLITVPTYGGKITEGMIGNPSLINPVLALTNTDKDIVSIVFSGLMRKNSNDNLVLDLAESFTVSEDGKIYTFKIKNDAKFHNGNSVTAEDIKYTISLITNPSTRSPKRANWEGVNIEILGEKEIKFILKDTFTGFLENTTIGILPKNELENIDPSNFSQHNFNQKPIGSGPYKITSVSKLKSGLIDTIELTSFKRYALGRPYINKIILKFYGNEQDLLKSIKTGVLDRAGPISPSNISVLNDIKLETSQLPRVFGLFFNQSKSEILKDNSIRNLINSIIDRDKLVMEVFNGFAIPNKSPFPKFIDQEKSEIDPVDILEKNGWKMGENGIRQKVSGKETVELKFKIATGDSEDLKKTALEIQKQMKNYGIGVEIESYELGILNQQIVGERNFEALLFGEFVPREENLYAFWHSSQRDFPGLNITGYINGKADQSLLTLLSENNTQKREMALKNFIDEMNKDNPAVFLYNPVLLIADKEKVKRNYIKDNLSQDRFSDINNWYTQTDRIWKIFN